MRYLLPVKADLDRQSKSRIRAAPSMPLDMDILVLTAAAAQDIREKIA